MNMILMLRALRDKISIQTTADERCEQRNARPQKEQKEMLATKYTITEMKSVLMGLLGDETQLRKESLSSRI